MHAWVIAESFSCQPLKGYVDLVLANGNKQYFFTYHTENHSTLNIGRDNTFLKQLTRYLGENRKRQNNQIDERKDKEIRGQ